MGNVHGTAALKWGSYQKIPRRWFWPSGTHPITKSVWEFQGANEEFWTKIICITKYTILYCGL